MERLVREHKHTLQEEERQEQEQEGTCDG